MKKKYVVLLGGVAVTLAVAAPAAIAAELPAAPPLPALPSLSGPVPNGGDCGFTPGTTTGSASGTIGLPPVPGLSGVNQGNDGNCQSFGNDQNNNQGSGLG